MRKRREKWKRKWGWQRWRSFGVTSSLLKREIKGKGGLAEPYPFCRYTGMSSIAFRGNRRSSLRTCCFQETSLFLWVSVKAWQGETAEGEKRHQLFKEHLMGFREMLLKFVIFKRRKHINIKKQYHVRNLTCVHGVLGYQHLASCQSVFFSLVSVCASLCAHIYSRVD